MAFGVCCLSLSIMCSRFIHVVAFLWLNNSSYKQRFCLSFISWWTFGLFSLFDYDELMRLWTFRYRIFAWMCFSFLLGICLGLKLLGHIHSMFNISRLCQTPFQRCCPIWQSHQQWGVPVFPHPRQHSLLLVSLHRPGWCEAVSPGFHFHFSNA